MGLNTGYFATNRGIIKIVQIILGIVICSILCGNWYGGRECFGEGRLGYVSGLNFVVLIINVVLLILNFVELGMWKLERLYSIVCFILFVIATGVFIWYIIERNDSRGWRVVTLASVFVQVRFYER